MKRLEYNLQILDKLKNYLEENPDIRFGQALSNLNIITYTNNYKGCTELVTNDPFYDESYDILKRVDNRN